MAQYKVCMKNSLKANRNFHHDIFMMNYYMPDWVPCNDMYDAIEEYKHAVNMQYYDYALIERDWERLISTEEDVSEGYVDPWEKV